MLCLWVAEAGSRLGCETFGIGGDTNAVMVAEAGSRLGCETSEEFYPLRFVSLLQRQVAV